MTLLRILLLSLVPSAALAQALPPLPALGTQGPASVSGVSSGAYMAVQLHLSQGERFAGGVASVAGGPFGCAEGSMFKALGPCLGRSAIDVNALVAATQAMAAKGEIQLPAQSRAFIFSGAKDSVVLAATSEALQVQLKALRPAAQIVVETQLPAAHGWVVEQGEGQCDRMAAPHLLPCGHDLAGQLLKSLLSPLQARGDAESGGRLLRFEQRAFHAGADLGDAGYVYIPKSCETAGGCRLHVALHGCQMNEAAVGDAFARRSGLNAWAATNRLVVLYPQTGKAAINACWDWWGYTGPGYLRSDAPQMKAINAMVDRLSAKQP